MALHQVEVRQTGPQNELTADGKDCLVRRSKAVGAVTHWKEM